MCYSCAKGMPAFLGLLLRREDSVWTAAVVWLFEQPKYFYLERAIGPKSTMLSRGSTQNGNPASGVAKPAFLTSKAPSSQSKGLTGSVHGDQKGE
jgi:hypothetical protein